MLKKLFVILCCLVLTGCATDQNANVDPDTVVGEPGQTPAESSYNTGMAYLLGHGVEQNVGQAIHWFEKSARAGSPYAENELGYLYVSGKGVPQDYQTAFSWYKKAADHGLASAQYTVGMMYQRGMGTPVDKVAGDLYLKKAAASGFRPAMQSLGKA